MRPEVSAKVDQERLPPGGGKVAVSLDIGLAGGAESGHRHVVFCIDASYSMKEQYRIQKAKGGAIRALKQLSADDYLSVITFAADTDVVVEPIRWSRADKSTVIDDIQSIGLRGYTDLIAGLEAARGGLGNMSDSTQAARRILLISDGNPAPKGLFQRETMNSSAFSLWTALQHSLAQTIGVTDDVVRAYEDYAKGLNEEGISVLAAGIGEEYNEEIVRALGAASQGEWTHLSESDEIEQFFRRAVAEAGDVVAPSPTLRIDPIDGTELLEVYRRQPQVSAISPNYDDGTAVIDLPDLRKGTEQQVVALVRADPQAPEEAVRLLTATCTANRTTNSDDATVDYVGGGVNTIPQRISVRHAFDDSKARALAVEEGPDKARAYLDATHKYYPDAQILEPTLTAVNRIDAGRNKNELREARDDATRID